MKEAQLDRLLSVKEAAEVLGIGQTTLYQRAAAGQVPTTVLWSGPRKKSLRFSAKAINRWIESNTIPAGGGVES